MKKILIVCAISLLLCGCGEEKNTEAEKNEKKTVTCSEMKTMIEEDKDAMLIDVRSFDEYMEGHLDGSINIEYGNIVRDLGDTDKDTTIIVYCKSGNRSNRAYESLKGAGYRNVYDLGSISNCN